MFSFLKEGRGGQRKRERERLRKKERERQRNRKVRPMQEKEKTINRNYHYVEDQVLDLLNKYFKLVVINIFKELKNCSNYAQRIKHSMSIMAYQIRNISKEIQITKKN